MPIANYEKAEEEAVRLLGKYDIIEPIIPVFELAERMNLKIVFFKPDEDEKLKEISGFLDGKNKTIYVNADDEPRRQLFTVAYELGHFVLKHKNSGILYRFFTPIDKDCEEQEANYFAANLLVPKEMLKETMKKYPLSKDNTESLAKLCGVPVEVIEFCLRKY